MSLRLSLPAAAALLLIAGPAAADAMRCGTHLISEGDTVGELHRYCGDPADIEHQTIQRPPIIWRYGRPIRVPGGDLEVQVEIWTYNLGPNQLQRRIRLEDGRVKQIETLGYGYL
jgi:uncharacterized protein DUF2845